MNNLLTYFKEIVARRTHVVSKYFFLLYLFFVFCSCNKRLSEVSIYSNLQEGDSISVALYSNIEERYITVNGASLSSSDANRGSVRISLPDSLFKNISSFFLEINCYSDSILEISKVRLKNYRTYYPQDIMNSLWWQQGLMFELDSKSKTIKSPINKDIPGIFSIYTHFLSMVQSRPTSIQLFYRLSFIATLILLTFIFHMQSRNQRFLLFTIALFLASIPLKYNDYAMGAMLLTMIISFFRNASRRFVWQPVFFVLCAMYLLDLIGMSYTVDFYS